MTVAAGPATLATTLIQHLTATRYADLPREAQHATKLSILDTLAVMLPATTMQGPCLPLLELASEIGASGSSTIIGCGVKVDVATAALTNGALAHALDYDDTTYSPVHHPTANTLPAALAIAEHLGGVSGKNLIAAVATGNDLALRLAAGAAGEHDGDLFTRHRWFPVTVFGTYSATAAAGKILGLSHAQMEHALGFAFNRVYGTQEGITDPRADMRAIRDGFTNRDGVTCAFLAAKGLRAPGDPFERLYKHFYGGNCDHDIVAAELGKRFRGVEAGYKAWPACGGSHASIQACLAIVREDSPDYRQITSVEITVPRHLHATLGRPIAVKRRPDSAMAARFSLPFVAATALVRGNVRLRDFLPEHLSDPDVLTVADKVSTRPFAEENGIVVPAEVVVRMADGTRYSRTANTLYGHPDNPLRHADLIQKFEDCAQYARQPVDSEQSARLVRCVMHLEQLDDVRALTGILNGDPGATEASV